MSSFRGAPIRTKMLLISLLTTGVTLVLVSAVLIVYELISFRHSLISELSIQANIISSNSAAALSFNDPKSAQETLLALSAAKHIVFATIYTKDGSVFARYFREKAKEESSPSFPQQEGYHFGINHLTLFQRIVFDKETIGAIYIRSDLKQLYARLKWYGMTVIIILILSLSVASFLSAKLQQAITNPILDLVGLMRIITKDKNYSSRATIQSQDELGIMAQGFNEMLEQIERRDKDLELYGEHLEEQVTKRTAELANANKQLQKELIERERAEEALRQSEERYRNILENLEDGYYEVDIQGNFTFFNDSLCKILGYSKEEAMGMNNRHYMEKESTEKIYQVFNRVYTIGEPWKAIDLKFIRKDGAKRFFETSVSLIRNAEGEGIGFRGVARDITERKRAEVEMASLQEQLRQSQKMEAIGKLAGGVAHDFNNLLTVIKGYSQLSLNELKEADPIKEHIEEIRKASERASDLTRQLLAFSRRQILEMKVLDLNTIIRDMDKMLRRILGEDIELVTILEENLGKTKSDRGQIEQIMMNLVVNARDGMSDGGKLTIETACVELDENYARTHVVVIPGRYVMLSVSDTGVGMTPEVTERAFEPFFTTKRVGEGTGLGLSTVYGIVKQCGGYIWIYSEPGLGTTFKIYLPRVEGEEDVINQKICHWSLFRGSEIILLVEDDPLVRNLSARILRNYGYTVLAATNGEEALRMVQEYAGKNISLLLTDVIMPQMGGKELAHRLKALRPDMEVIFTSGYTDNAIVHHGILEEGVNFIQKPFTVEGLVRKVREVLDKQFRNSDRVMK